MAEVEILVTYDVATETPEGRRRLRRVAKACEAYGQRVQKSVFECVVGEMDLEKLKHRLVQEIDADQDSLRIYRLREPRQRFVQVFGQKPQYDLEAPLIL